MSTAAIYCRISRDQEDEGRGVALQEQLCRAICERRGWHVGQVFVDNDVSATSGKRRSAFEELLTGVSEGRFGVVVALDLDRLTRSHRDLLRIVDACTAHGVKVQFDGQGGFDPTTGDGMVEIEVRTSIAAEEVRKLRRRVTRRAQARAEEGAHNGGMRPFGYSDAARSSVVEVEAEAIRAAAAILLRNGSMAEAVRAMNALSRTTQGREWTVPKMQRTLTAPSIAGDRALRGRVVARDCWPAILIPEEHERVVEVIEGRRRRGTRTARSYLLSGIATCGRCDTPLIAQPWRGQRAYRCPQPNRTVNGPRGCGGSRILAEELDEHVVMMAMSFATDPDRIAQDKRSAAMRPAEEANTRKALEALAIREANLAVAVVDGMPRAQYRRKQAELEDERAFLEHKLTELTSALEPALVKGSTAEEARRRFDGLELNQQRAVIQSLLARVRVNAVRSGRQRIQVAPDWGPMIESAERYAAEHNLPSPFAV